MTSGEKKAIAAVQARMTELDLKKAQVARRTGLDAGTVGDFLNGKRWPLAENRRRIEEVLHWPTGAIQAMADGGPPPGLSQVTASRSTSWDTLAQVGAPWVVRYPNRDAKFHVDLDSRDAGSASEGGGAAVRYAWPSNVSPNDAGAITAAVVALRQAIDQARMRLEIARVDLLTHYDRQVELQMQANLLIARLEELQSGPTGDTDAAEVGRRQSTSVDERVDYDLAARRGVVEPNPGDDQRESGEWSQDDQLDR